MPFSPLPREFYNRSALEVARDLLGARLVRADSVPGARLAGILVETEAYQGEEDLGCHAHAGRTPRTQIMYGPPGYAYIYFTYGMHWLLNVVTGPVDSPAAVLLRAIQPTEGLEVIASRRAPQPQSLWTDGPAKLTRALAIDGKLNGVDLCSTESGLFIEAGEPVADEAVAQTARIGLFTVPEPWKSIPWRFVVKKEGSHAKTQRR